MDENKPEDTNKHRCGSQCMRILELLRKGPQTNDTLVEVALKYTARISDLRKNGYEIKCTNGLHRVRMYTLLNKANKE